MKGGKYSCKVSKVHLKLRDQQLKASTRTYWLLHKHLMVTAKQKSINRHSYKKKEKEIQT